MTPARAFNSGFDKLTNAYEGAVTRIIRRRWIMLATFAVIMAVTGLLFVRLPTAFLPDEDQGTLMTIVQLPESATLERTAAVMDDVRKYYAANEEDNIMGLFTVAGFSVVGQGQNNGMAFAAMNDWSERPGPENSVQSIAGRAFGGLSQIDEARIFPIVPPPIREMGNSNGFDLYIQNTGGLTHAEFVDARNQLLGMASQDPRLMGVRPNGSEDGPQFKMNLDYQKAQALGVSVADATSVLSVAFGGSYVNDFIDRGRIKRVYVQGDAEDRMQPEDISKWHVRTSSGEMTPLDEIVSGEWSYGSPQLQRFGGVPAINIQGSPAEGESSGVAMQIMEDMVSQLAGNISLEWSGLSRQERQAGNQATMLYILSLLFVFLCLAALYESWTIPVSVLLVAPLGVTGAVSAANLFGLANDVFFQVGLLMTVGLASKNAILVVEFARTLEDQGKDVVTATIEAVRQRIRPVLMTSFAFGFGVLPLALSTGAGSESRNAMGWIMVGGVIAAMTFSLLFAPLFFVLVRQVTTRLRGQRPATSGDQA